MDGVAQVQSLIDRYNEVMAMWADPDADYDKIGKEQAELEERSSSTRGAWTCASSSCVNRSEMVEEVEVGE